MHPAQRRFGSLLGIDRTTMVAMLDALEGKGLVSRHPHARDRRRNVVELTDAGRETLRLAAEANDAAEQLRSSLQTLVLPSDD